MMEMMSNNGNNNRIRSRGDGAKRQGGLMMSMMALGPLDMALSQSPIDICVDLGAYGKAAFGSSKEARTTIKFLMGKFFLFLSPLKAIRGDFL